MKIFNNIFLRKKILIYGLGKSGISSYKFLKNKSDVYLFDDNQKIKFKLKKKIIKIREKLKKNLPTVPTTLIDEIECNIFLRAKDLDSFSKLRELKDNF